MKNSMDITRGYQIGYVLLRALFGSFVCMMLEFAMFMSFFHIPVLKYIMGGIVVLIYACFLYTASATLGKFDAKEYTPLKVQYYRPLIWGAIIAGINILMVVVYMLNWSMMPQNAEVPSVISIIINAVFYFWNSPYFAFIVRNVGENLPLYVILMSVFVPPVACFLGYYAGSRKIFVSDKLNDFMFEKGDSEE